MEDERALVISDGSELSADVSDVIAEVSACASASVTPPLPVLAAVPVSVVPVLVVPVSVVPVLVEEEDEVAGGSFTPTNCPDELKIGVAPPLWVETVFGGLVV